MMYSDCAIALNQSLNQTDISKNVAEWEMKITITTGTGEGPTPLAAFDQALLDAGVANYNLIYLSSIIPPNSVIERGCYVTPPDEYGHRLYLVMASQRVEEPGTSAWAGIGWTQESQSG